MLNLFVLLALLAPLAVGGQDRPAQVVSAQLRDLERASDPVQRAEAAFGLQATVLVAGALVDDPNTLAQACALLVDGIAADLASNDEHYDSWEVRHKLIDYHTLLLWPSAVPRSFQHRTSQPVEASAPSSRRHLAGIQAATFSARTATSEDVLVRQVTSRQALGLVVSPARSVGGVVRTTAALMVEDTVYQAIYVGLYRQTPGGLEPLAVEPYNIRGNCSHGSPCYPTRIDMREPLSGSTQQLGNVDPDLATALDVGLQRRDPPGGWGAESLLGLVTTRDYVPLLRTFDHLRDAELRYRVEARVSELTHSPIPREIILAWMKWPMDERDQRIMISVILDRSEVDVSLLLEGMPALSGSGKEYALIGISKRAVDLLKEDQAGSFAAGPAGDVDRAIETLAKAASTADSPGRFDGSLLTLLDAGLDRHGREVPLADYLAELPGAEDERVPGSGQPVPWKAARAWGADVVALQWSTSVQGGEVFWLRREGRWTRAGATYWIS